MFSFLWATLNPCPCSYRPYSCFFHPSYPYHLALATLPSSQAKPPPRCDRFSPFLPEFLFTNALNSSSSSAGLDPSTLNSLLFAGWTWLSSSRSAGAFFVAVLGVSAFALTLGAGSSELLLVRIFDKWFLCCCLKRCRFSLRQLSCSKGGCGVSNAFRRALKRRRWHGGPLSSSFPPFPHSPSRKTAAQRAGPLCYVEAATERSSKPSLPGDPQEGLDRDPRRNNPNYMYLFMRLSKSRKQFKTQGKSTQLFVCWKRAIADPQYKSNNPKQRTKCARRPTLVQ